MFAVTPIYVAIAVVMYSVMSFRVIGGRYAHRVSLGDGDKPQLTRLIRGHANFAEYAPLALIALGAAELTHAPAVLLHAGGATLVLGRALHAYCFLFTESGMRSRRYGMILTLASLWISAGAALWMALAA